MTLKLPKLVRIYYIYCNLFEWLFVHKPSFCPLHINQFQISYEKFLFLAVLSSFYVIFSLSFTCFVDHPVGQNTSYATIVNLPQMSCNFMYTLVNKHVKAMQTQHESCQKFSNLTIVNNIFESRYVVKPSVFSLCINQLQSSYINLLILSMFSSFKVVFAFAFTCFANHPVYHYQLIYSWLVFKTWGVSS